MSKNLNAYISLEASLIFPMLIVLYYLIVTASLVLSARCLDSQNSYIRLLKDAGFTYRSEEYNEVIFDLLDPSGTEGDFIYINPINKVRSERE